MNLDQASFLRELMNKTQQVKTNPVAVLATSDFEIVEESIRKTVQHFSDKTQRKVALFGLDFEMDISLEQCVNMGIDIDVIIERMSQKTLNVPGALKFLSKIRNDKELSEKLVSYIKQMEKESDTLFYYAGRGMDTTAVNLAMRANKVLVLMKPSAQSIDELTKYVKIFSKTKTNNELGVILDTRDVELYKEQTKKIQELYWKEFKYYIEPIGFFDSRMNHRISNDFIEEFKTDYLIKKTETKMFSESIQEMFL